MPDTVILGKPIIFCTYDVDEALNKLEKVKDLYLAIQ
jgi:hypothetical protein